MSAVQKAIKVHVGHWVKRATKVTKVLTARRVTSAKKANEDRKVFKAQPA